MSQRIERGYPVVYSDHRMSDTYSLNVDQKILNFSLLLALDSLHAIAMASLPFSYFLYQQDCQIVACVLQTHYTLEIL